MMSKAFKSILPLFPHPNTTGGFAISVDLGSCCTRVSKGNQLLFCEPSCVVLHKETNEVIAIGNEAVKLLGKIPPSFESVWPIRKGKITQVEAAKKYINQIFQQVLKSQRSIENVFAFFPFYPSSQVRFALAELTNAVDKKSYQRIIEQRIFRPIFVSKSLAIWKNYTSQLPKTNQMPVFIIDMGGMTTEVALVSQGEVVRQKSILLGGEDITQAVIQVVREKYQVEVGWEVAEYIKKQLGRVKVELQPEKMLTLRGRHLLTSLPVTFTVAASAFENACMSILEEIFQEVRDFCQICPAETISSAMENGIFLTGSASLLAGVAESFWQKKLHAPCIFSKFFVEDVVRGTELLEKNEQLKNSHTPTAK